MHLGSDVRAGQLGADLRGNLSAAAQIGTKRKHMSSPIVLLEVQILRLYELRRVLITLVRCAAETCSDGQLSAIVYGYGRSARRNRSSANAGCCAYGATLSRGAATRA